MPEVPNTQDDSIEIGPFLLCPHCKEGRKFEEQTFIKYFQGTELLCRNCSKKINLWKGVLSLLTDSPFIRYGAIGANSTAFQVPITLGEPREITFEEFGVPSEAQILWLNYTPQGGNLQALEMHGNTPSRYSIPSVVTIYPIPFNEGKPTSEGVLNILVIWAKFEGDETESAAWRNLVEATDFFMQGRLRQSLIPSQTVVELMLSQFLSRYYSRVAAHEYVDRMFNGGASYSHQLNVLLPGLTAALSLPELDSHIRGQLNRLRDLRNEQAHGKISKKKLDGGGAAELLCATIFAFQYIKLLNSMMSESGHVVASKQKSNQKKL